MTDAVHVLDTRRLKLRRLEPDDACRYISDGPRRIAAIVSPANADSLRLLDAEYPFHDC